MNADRGRAGSITTARIGLRLLPSSSSSLFVSLLLGSLVLMLYAAWRIRPVEVQATDLVGFASHLPFAYWMGLGALLICSTLGYLNAATWERYRIVALLVAFGFFLFGVPVFAFQEPIHPFTYYPASEVGIILHNGRLVQRGNTDVLLLSYSSWPALHLLSSALILSSNIGLKSIIRYSPLFWTVLVVLAAYRTGMRLGLAEAETFLTCLLLLLSTWGFWVGYLPMGLGFLLYVVAMSFVVSPSVRISDVMAFLLCSLAIISAHPLMGLVLVVSVVPVCLYLKRPVWMFVAAGVFVSWQTYYATRAAVLGANLVLTLRFLDLLALPGELTHWTSSTARLVARYGQLAYTVVYGLALVVSVFRLLWHNPIPAHKRLSAILLLWIFGAAWGFFIPYGSAEIAWRILWVSAFPSAAAIAIGMRRSVGLLVTVLALVALHMPAHYGGYAAFEQVLTSELRGAEFFASRVRPRFPDSYFYTFSPALVWFFDPTLLGTPVGPSYEPNYPAWTDPSYVYRFTYTLISRESSNFMRFRQGDDPFRTLIESEGRGTPNAIYSSGAFDIYDNRTVTAR